MGELNIFQWLVSYQNRNLEMCAPYIVDGRIQIKVPKLVDGRVQEVPKHLEEAYDENELYKGVLIIANGTTLAARLKEGKVLLSELEEWASIESEEQFLARIARQRNNDGAYIVDGVNKRITRASELNNNPPMQRELNLYDMIPRDFVSHDCSVQNEGNIGTKSRLAIKIPHAYDHTEAFQVKRSAYTPLGMGKVTHFGREGLIQEYFFQPSGEEILGVHRRYSRDSEGRLYRAEEKKEVVMQAVNSLA